ncbi:MAG: putative Cell division cycle protein [Streblomastix strix]|uniref:Putative Cell division cycle protein n=1 Tax=Streblomastix strix TaxID=222440 RepID=A0A5J4VYJ1_9EUKA|nr:MAG: putative Cell division cycle protein [Streblomastix strix]
MKLTDNVDFEAIAKESHGNVEDNLAPLTVDAVMQFIRENLALIDIKDNEIDAEQLNSMSVTNDHFKASLQKSSPSTLSEFSVEESDVTWDDVGGLDYVKKNLKEGVGKLQHHKQWLQNLKQTSLQLKEPELLTMWFGESEANAHKVFDKARGSSPSVLFFDEFDSIA